MTTIAPAPTFPGISPPSTDFQAVRDGRRSMPFELMLDLATARSIAAGTAAIVGVAGNSFYSDPLIDASGNPIGGLIVARFEDVTLNPGGSRFTVAPQFIARIPFTRILLENPAQPGKFARILYGTDIDFTPGINAQVTIAGAVSVRSVGQNYGSKFTSTTALNSGVNEQIFAPGVNVNGVIVHAIGQQSNSAGNGVGFLCVHAHTGAPAAATDGDMIATDDGGSSFAGGEIAYHSLKSPLLLPAGKGAWRRNNSGANHTTALFSQLYTAL